MELSPRSAGSVENPFLNRKFRSCRVSINYDLGVRTMIKLLTLQEDVLKTLVRLHSSPAATQILQTCVCWPLLNTSDLRVVTLWLYIKCITSPSVLLVAAAVFIHTLFNKDGRHLPSAGVITQSGSPPTASDHYPPPARDGTAHTGYCCEFGWW